ncbi:MAG: SDR family NAD(P)-dependent oxidoreductase [Prolixibacteraceae bacterium]|jgi:3-hydroxy acid dehydrogenase / malonic semialdehyde reductase|nr:SDR family NAD(P)-dependent oxidoreductase [Prolixibacteraceae bacterium]MBT6007113.1 SDR family NAD(P)-dependent oxidoreductase [Prolixibacteraceae bacterium]MBT6763758.1 SDR family NAD(P)-dependent oxidoreductase [Prolixibacteraceae bacterium]MBT7000666.1 SDR family NAD(P)-dependent oxidoreductase [Prolixibacteraceae bacterium]MBT7397362.1 SDR family NAD(P)-dependent oxidoreductase [Prolixibacteraceae bacterium]
MNKIALITGATAGIGEATAVLLAQNKYNLILTGRRKERLDLIKEKITKQTSSKVTLLQFDIRSSKETKNAINSLPKPWLNIDVLINNAGLAAGFSTIQEGTIDDWERMIDTNIKGLLYITRLISPIMIKNGTGHIVNLSSIAGKETYPLGNVYCATKHAVQSVTKGMRIDLLKHGIKVSSVSPGAVNTEFAVVRFSGDTERAKQVYEGFTPLQAQDVAETILFVITRPIHVNIDDILVMPTDQAFSRDFNKKP